MKKFLIFVLIPLLFISCNSDETEKDSYLKNISDKELFTAIYFGDNKISDNIKTTSDLRSLFLNEKQTNSEKYIFYLKFKEFLISSLKEKNANYFKEFSHKVRSNNISDIKETLIMGQEDSHKILLEFLHNEKMLSDNQNFETIEKGESTFKINKEEKKTIRLIFALFIFNPTYPDTEIYNPHIVSAKSSHESIFIDKLALELYEIF